MQHDLSLGQVIVQTLKRLRAKRSLSQEKLGLLADIDRTFVSAVERGRRNITLRTLDRILPHLCESPEQFCEALLEHFHPEKSGIPSTDKADWEHVLSSLIEEHFCISYTDKLGIITDVNHNFCRAVGFERGELIGQDHRVLKSGVHPRSFMARLWQTVERGDIFYGRICNKHRSGKLIWMLTGIFPLRNQLGIIDRYLTIRTDIREATSPMLLLEDGNITDDMMEPLSALTRGMGHEITEASQRLGQSIDRLSQAASLPAEQLAAEVHLMRATLKELVNLGEQLNLIGHEKLRSLPEQVNLSDSLRTCLELAGLSPICLKIHGDTANLVSPFGFSKDLLNKTITELLRQAASYLKNHPNPEIQVSFLEAPLSMGIDIRINLTEATTATAESSVGYFTTAEGRKWFSPSLFILQRLGVKLSTHQDSPFHITCEIPKWRHEELLH